MRIGILSDSHGRADTTRLAIKHLQDHGADLLIHLGDIGGDQVIDELAGIKARIVFGNCDWDISGLTRYARFLGVEVDHPLGIVQTENRRVAFTHGHLPHCMNQALNENVDYLLHGHTHEWRDERVGHTRIINPGALFRASRYTVAVLDPAADTLEIVEVAKADPVHG